MIRTKIGFIGFGEVGSIFTKTMQEAGTDITIYDILLDDPDRAEDMEKRIVGSGNKVGTLKQVLENNDFIISAVITQAAKKVAKTVSPMLHSSQIYVDLNSTSPRVKVEISKTIASTNADFVEGAILGAVGTTGARTRIFTGGNKRQIVTDLFNGLGLNAHSYSADIGKASMFKMLRSIFSKGVEIVLLEMMVAGKRAGIEKDLWQDITQFMAAKSFDKIGSNWMQSHAVAYERRYYEMLQVVETMKEIGITPLITNGTVAFFKQSRDQKMNNAFPKKPDSFDEVVEFIDKQHYEY